MKVIPYDKTVENYEGLGNSSHWKGAININQYYLFVTDWHESTNAFSLGIEINDSGDFFNACDFEPYIKTQIPLYPFSLPNDRNISDAFEYLKSKGVTPEMYEKLWNLEI